MINNSLAGGHAGRSTGRFWHDPAVRSLLIQASAFLIIAATAYYLVSNLVINLNARNIPIGLNFLSERAGFDIGDTAIAYTANDTYGRALIVGVLNTLKVSLIAIALATVIGVIVGIARLSQNFLVKNITRIYVEYMRNVPLLLQLFFWYALLTKALPGARDALNPAAGVFLSNRGLFLPTLETNTDFYYLMAGLFVGLAAAVFWAVRTKGIQKNSGRQLPVLLPVLGLLGIGGLLGWLLGPQNIVVDMPALKGFNFKGGIEITTEFLCLLLGLVTYTSAFIAENVRSGILSVNKGQHEAASSLGLSPARSQRLIILPQALRVIIPPTTSQYMNVIKNSSLGVAIGYPDLVSVAGTSLNQTGQAVECISLIMLVYLFTSLSTSLFMNWYNARVALAER
ncbi:amino acid ABC transporter permease [Parendozoicomonas haliclonae]|uniref:Putative glutamine ABC transporter permease protein GlnM n=1 Tax=Parendozoicomonas haliclonae TaxID=1960125 RepID=A0A1X7AJ89_9GAMM|nr:ABC transporter permease subunit [Parendozoicomonas haliclonae]SMA46368.1 putative glutamine ABC transporter permease protein GlnM [Parendozoicomonas haliclonae]